MSTTFRKGDKVVVDGTLIVTVEKYLTDGSIVAETGHGTIIVDPSRAEAAK